MVKVFTAGIITVKSSVVSQAALLLFTKCAICSKEKLIPIPLRSGFFSLFLSCLTMVLFLQGYVDVGTSPSLFFPHHAQLSVD